MSDAGQGQGSGPQSSSAGPGLEWHVETALLLQPTALLMVFTHPSQGPLSLPGHLLRMFPPSLLSSQCQQATTVSVPGLMEAGHCAPCAGLKSHETTKRHS